MREVCRRGSRLFLLPRYLRNRFRAARSWASPSHSPCAATAGSRTSRRGNVPGPTRHRCARGRSLPVQRGWRHQDLPEFWHVLGLSLGLGFGRSREAGDGHCRMGALCHHPSGLSWDPVTWEPPVTAWAHGGAASRAWLYRIDPRAPKPPWFLHGLSGTAGSWALLSTPVLARRCVGRSRLPIPEPLGTRMGAKACLISPRAGSLALVFSLRCLAVSPALVPDVRLVGACVHPRESCRWQQRGAEIAPGTPPAISHIGLA